MSYSISPGSVTPLSEELQSATPSQDFTAVQGYIDIPDHNVSSTIPVQILDDSLPEVDEVFIVTLTGVTLVNASDASSMPPKLGNVLCKMQLYAICFHNSPPPYTLTIYTSNNNEKVAGNLPLKFYNPLIFYQSCLPTIFWTESRTEPNSNYNI